MGAGVLRVVRDLCRGFVYSALHRMSRFRGAFLDGMPGLLGTDHRRILGVLAGVLEVLLDLCSKRASDGGSEDC